VRIPDWLIYLVVLAGVVYTLTSSSDNDPAPQAPPVPIERAGSVLPAPSMFDEEVLVEVDDNPGAATGTAFAVGPEGNWLTARHVVDGCSDLAIAIGRRKIVPVTNYKVWERGDLALLQTDGGPDRAVLNLFSDLKVGQRGYHIGYPQAKPGEVTSRLLSRSRLVTRGRYLTNEPVLAWAETGRTSGLVGSLGGISGGPVYNAAGEVVGVTVAESPRRGRIYTTAPRSIAEFLPDYSDEELTNTSTRSITTDNYGEEADRLRRILTVVPVICRARN
jgi:serine protease Do